MNDEVYNTAVVELNKVEIDIKMTSLNSVKVVQCVFQWKNKYKLHKRIRSVAWGKVC